MKRLVVGLLCWLVCLQAADVKGVERLGEKDLLLVKTKVRFSTLILLPEGEEIAEVTCGDKDFWVVEAKDNAVFIKPAKEGALTNVNVIAKSKSIYSFLVQEISKPGTKDKPDLKVLLDVDPLTKLRKDKENLEALLARNDGELADLKAKAGEASTVAKKKDSGGPSEVDIHPQDVAPPVPLEKVQVKAEGHQAPRPTVVVAHTTTQPLPADPPPPAIVFDEEPPAVRVTVVEKSEGFVRKSGRFLGRLFRKVSNALHLY